MLYLYTGTHRQNAREALNKRVLKIDSSSTVHITDAHTLDDLRASMSSGGMFATTRSVVLEGVLQNEELASVLLDALSALQDSSDHFFLLEEKLDAPIRKRVEKYAEMSEKFDLAKKGDAPTTIFALANALKRGDKKSLWVAYMRELHNDTAPEAIHGVLFWGAKDMMLKARSDSEARLAGTFVALLAELPHESRRRGEELEYALERFVLSFSLLRV
jgi:hypothetical protein